MARRQQHECLLADLDDKVMLNGGKCRPGEPALLSPEQMKLHYVVHYRNRGFFDKYVPEPSEEKKHKIEMYVCNYCKKKFRNFIAKKEFPGRGSVICHIATEHGKIIEAMEEEKEVDMKEAIDLMLKHDAALKKLYDKGRIKTPYDNDFIKVVEASVWSLGQISKTVPVKGSSDSNNNNNNNTTSASQKQAEKTEPSAAVMEMVNMPLSCPKCKKYKQGGNKSQLKFHLIEHYVYVWMGVYEEADIPEDSLEYGCSKCPKRVNGSTPRGLRNAIICHWALQHGELFKEMRKDKAVDPKFIDFLSKSDPKPTYTAAPAPRATVKPTEAPKPPVHKPKPCPASKKRQQEKRKAPESSSSSSEEEEDKNPLDISFSSTDSDAEDDQKSVASKPGPKCSKKQKVNRPGYKNENYIRKRPKVNFTLSSDDSEEWSADETEKNHQKNRRKATEPASGTGSDNKRPRRAATENIDFREKEENEFSNKCNESSESDMDI